MSNTLTVYIGNGSQHHTPTQPDLMWTKQEMHFHGHQFKHVNSRPNVYVLEVVKILKKLVSIRFV